VEQHIDLTGRCLLEIITSVTCYCECKVYFF